MMMQGLRRTFGAVVIGLAAALALPAGAQASAATTSAVQLVSSEVVRQAPANPIGRLNAAGGVILIAPAGERLGRLSGHYAVDLSGLQCSFVEVADSITFRFSAADTLTVRASGSDISTDGCAGRSFHRVLSWRVTGGTGRYVSARGNGTATGTLNSRPSDDFATSRMAWRGLLVG